jgi:hypothetical protein
MTRPAALLGVLWLAAVGCPALVSSAEPEISFEAVPPDAWTGEPYELAGKRMVFTSWYYVRPGGYAWVDEQGNPVSARRDLKIGPWGPRFQRADDAPRGIRLIAEKPERVGPVIEPDRPWEEMGVSVYFVLHEGNRYRAWGSCQDKEGTGYTCYFESSDGQTWNRPNLGLVEYDGSKENNLIPEAPRSMFVDPTAPPDERYKGVAESHVSPEEFRAFIAKHPDRWEHRALRKDAHFILGVYGYVSPDGLRWTRMSEPFTIEHCDTQVIGAYDAVGKKYLIFTRTWFVGPRSPRAPEDPVNMSWLGESRGAGRRSIGYTESDRFGDFPVSRILLSPRSDMSPSQLLYTNGYTTMPGAADHHLLFPTVWDTSDDATHLEMAASHDGRLWNWVPGGPLMQTGAFGRFDGGCIFWHPNLIELADGDFALFYTGYEFPHKYPRGAWSYRPGYAVWPKGRIVAVEAAETGEFSTVSFFAPGRKLQINAVTKRAGHVLVAVTRRDGRFLPGRSFDEAVPIVGDQHRTVVQWQQDDDLGFEENEPISLRFRMNKAKIYGVDFE